MRYVLSCVLAIGVLGLALSAKAEPSEAGFSAAARLGYGIPMGKVAGDATDISDGVTGKIPIWVDVGYRLSPALFLGGYFQYGIGIPKDCPTGASCSVGVKRLGFEAVFHLMSDAGFNPWVGAGLGYEWLSISYSGDGQTVDGGADGFEFLNLQLGGDFAVNDQFGIGPYAAFSVGQYDTRSISSGGATLSASIDDKAFHEWLQFGVKCTFDL